MTDFSIMLMKKIGFSDEEQSFVEELSTKYENNATYLELLDKFDKELIKSDELDEKLEKEAEKNGDHVYSLRLLFCLEAAEAALPKYLKLGYTEDLFYSNMKDIKCKLDVGESAFGVMGVQAPMAWFDRFYVPDRFWLGRFQFETMPFFEGCDDKTLEKYEKDGVVIKKGDTVINVHIPEGSGPMTEELAFEAYDMACDFYKEMYEKQGYLVFVCHSWLLYDKHPLFLSPESNIIKFMNQYDILDPVEEDKFGNGWRVFGSEFTEEYEKLPEKTSLQRAYKKWLCDGNKAGYAYGIRIHRKGDR